MTFKKKLFLIVTLQLVSFSVLAQDQDLGEYQWKSRVILLKESSMESDWLKAQIKRLQSEIDELNERQLLVFIIADSSVYDIEQNEIDLSSERLINQYSLSSFQGLILIGKDGSVKLKEPFVVNPKTIFELIDSMPMRQAEIKNRQPD